MNASHLTHSSSPDFFVQWRHQTHHGAMEKFNGIIIIKTGRAAHIKVKKIYEVK